nr:MAG TPA_asm: hypothetical protein [Bacteriophage sp.]
MQQYHTSHLAQYYTCNRNLHRAYYLSILLYLIESLKALLVFALHN